MNSQRQYTQLDTLIIGLSRTLANSSDTLFARSETSRSYPGTREDSVDMSEGDRVQSGRYMRVNHVGEICAQALYQSQALTAKDNSIKDQMQHAAEEETDHLAWCEQRIEELGSRKSVLNPLWYAGSFAIGTVAGITGDKWNLGFVAETERQVVNHLEDHLCKLPENDLRSRQVVEQMKQDEARHAEQASAAGAAQLPPPAKLLMKLAAKIMTKTAYWV